MGAESAPILSVIIPTRERCQTLPYTIRTALAQDVAELEVIVSDNASEDDTPRVLQSFSDPRLRSVRAPRRLSMCDHWEFALGHARGRYVLFIGDDDAVMPGRLSALFSFIDTAPSALYYWPRHMYHWPIAGKPAYVSVIVSSGSMRRMKLAQSVRRSLQLGGWGFQTLPKAYHAAVARDLLEELKRRTGRVFHSTQPDVFTAFALPALCGEAIDLGFPVTMMGRSAQSTGGSVRLRSSDGNAVIRRFLEEYDGYKMHSALPLSLSDRADGLLLSDTILTALDLFPDFYADVRFNYSAAWALSQLMGERWWDFRTTARALRKQCELRRGYPFNVIDCFRAYFTVKFSSLRSALVQRLSPQIRAFNRNCPSDVLECATRLAQEDRLPSNVALDDSYSYGRL
jgi:hypothetical protein